MQNFPEQQPKNNKDEQSLSIYFAVGLLIGAISVGVALIWFDRVQHASQYEDRPAYGLVGLLIIGMAILCAPSLKDARR